MSDRPPDGDTFDTYSRRGFIRGSVLVGGGTLACAATAAGVASAGADMSSPRGPTLDVRDFGATGDGRTSATRALQHAIDAAHRLGGGNPAAPPGPPPRRP